MTKYLTINTANKNKNDLLNELVVFGWKLHSDKIIPYKDDIEIYGGFDDDDDRPLMELTLIFENEGNNADKLYDLSLKYLDTKRKYMSARDVSVAKLVTGLVFGTLLTILGIILLCFSHGDPTNISLTMGLCALLFGFPAYPLCIIGIAFKEKNAKKGTAETKETIEQLKREAESLK